MNKKDEEKCLVIESKEKCQCSGCKDRRFWAAQVMMWEIQSKIFQIVLGSMKEEENSHA